MQSCHTLHLAAAHTTQPMQTQRLSNRLQEPAHTHTHTALTQCPIFAPILGMSCTILCWCAAQCPLHLLTWLWLPAHSAPHALVPLKAVCRLSSWVGAGYQLAVGDDSLAAIQLAPASMREHARRKAGSKGRWVPAVFRKKTLISRCKGQLWAMNPH